MTVTSPSIRTGTWTIDPAHSEVGFTVRHLGLSKVRGRFNDFSGTAVIGETLAGASVEAAIELASIDTNNDQRDEHLRSADFLDVENVPRMTFRSTSVELDDDTSGTIHGELTIGDVTRAVELDTELHGVAVDAYGTTRAGFTATTRISRDDFGIDFQVPLDAGGVLIGDKVTIELEIQLVPEAS